MADRQAPRAPARLAAGSGWRGRGRAGRLAGVVVCAGALLDVRAALPGPVKVTAAAPAAPVVHAAASVAQPLPAAALAVLAGSGLPLKSFGLAIRPVETPQPAYALNAEEPFLLASTAKVVTSLAALQLLGPAHQWRTQAFATAPVEGGRTAGDLVIVGGSAGLTPADLRRWFVQMRREGLSQVGGRIVLDHFSLLYEQHPAQAATTAAEEATGGAPDPRTYNVGALVVSVQPAAGANAGVTLTPRPPGVVIVNDVLMGGGCSARARWATAQEAGAGKLQLMVSGRWDASCGRQDIAFIRLPPGQTLAAPAQRPTPAAPVTVSVAGTVAALWAEAGNRPGVRVVEVDGVRGTGKPLPAASEAAWTSGLSSALSVLLREMNKTSNNSAAKGLLLALAPAGSVGPLGPSVPGSALPMAQDKVRRWLQAQGLADDDLHLDEGSGQSRVERGKPRAMVQLLCSAWKWTGSREFIESLPVAGVDGTLARRMNKGPATGRAFLKTGTLSDTRALAGYVLAQSGRVYAISIMVTHPEAARATPALDGLIEWLARAG